MQHTGFDFQVSLIWQTNCQRLSIAALQQTYAGIRVTRSRRLETPENVPSVYKKDLIFLGMRQLHPKFLFISQIDF